MANEFKHAVVGGELSKAEWEAVGTHILNSQAIGDMIYAPSATQLSRFPLGTPNQVIHVAGGAHIRDLQSHTKSPFELLRTEAYISMGGGGSGMSSITFAANMYSGER